MDRPSTRQWMIATTTDKLGDDQVRETVYPPNKAETYEGMVRRLRDAGRDFLSGPGWIAYTSSHYALSESWTSHTRLEWTDEDPAGGAR